MVLANSKQDKINNNKNNNISKINLTYTKTNMKQQFVYALLLFLDALRRICKQEHYKQKRNYMYKRIKQTI